MAKTLLTDTIKIRGINAPDNITIFTCDNPSKPHYKDISKYAKRYVSITFQYEENDNKSQENLIRLTLPSDKVDAEMRDWIINEINKTL
jgi:hypothetical protein